MLAVIFLLSRKEIPVNPVIVVLAGTVFSLFWIFFSYGYKRMWFYILSAAGILLAAASLKLLPRLSGFVLLKNSAVDITAALVLFVFCRYVSTRSFFNLRRFGVLMLIVTGAVLWGVNIYPPEFIKKGENLVYSGEIDAVLEGLSPYYRELGGEVEKRIKKILEDNSLSRKEKDALIKELNSRIKQLEEESARLEEVKKENERYRDEIAQLKEKLKGSVLCPGLENSPPVTSFKQAVHGSKGMVSPCVRDFAVRLASSHPGSYYVPGSSVPIPGADGIAQIIAVHRYISTQWKYVNDPLSTVQDYYSPADRTIAAGLAGDCDDFAILMAASIEAIGGKARILGGTCSEGAHAWCEVYIGDEHSWNRAVKIITSEYPGIRIQHTVPRNSRDYWLSLDWKIGEYSCGGSPVVLYY